MKKILLILIISTSFISCYIADNNSDTGSITFTLPGSMKADAVVDQILKLRFFNEGEMLAFGNPMTAEIYYDKPDYPSPVPVTGQSEFSYTSLDSSGTVTVTGVPSEKPLQILAEYLVESYVEGSGLWYIDRAGLSNSFTVNEGENTNVSIALFDAVYGSVTVNNDYEWSSCYFRAYEPDDLDNFVTLSGSTVTEFNSEPTVFCENSGTIEGTLLFQEAILPGKKIKLLISPTEFIDMEDTIGLSEEFELKPGEIRTITLNYYTSFDQLS